jgi:hypothetical protein
MIKMKKLTIDLQNSSIKIEEIKEKEIKVDYKVDTVELNENTMIVFNPSMETIHAYTQLEEYLTEETEEEKKKNK